MFTNKSIDGLNNICGKNIADTLNTILYKVAFGEIKNEKRALLDFAKTLREEK